MEVKYKMNNAPEARLFTIVYRINILTDCLSFQHVLFNRNDFNEYLVFYFILFYCKFNFIKSKIKIYRYEFTPLVFGLSVFQYRLTKLQHLSC